jgi:hypothetical protein
MTDTPAHEQTQQTIEQLKSRLERAERQMKGLQFSIPGLAVLTGVALFMQTGLFNSKPTVISVKSVIAESFAVQSARGDIVAQLSASSDGSPSITFLDANKKVRLMASVGVSDGSPSITFFDANKKVRLMATIGVSGPSVSLLDPQEVSRATLSLNDKSDPSLALYNADKLPRSVFAIDNGGSGHLSLYGTAGGLLDLAAHVGRVRWTPSGGAPVDALPVTK